MTFLRQFVAGVLGLALAYCIVATLVNPRRVFGSALFPEVIPNSRGMKISYFDAYNRAATVRGILLGSSTSMQLDPATFDSLTGERFFNFALFVGRPEDFLAIYRLLRSRGVPIHRMILGLDLLSFDPHLGPASDFTSNLELQSSLRRSAPTAGDRLVHLGTLYKDAMTFSYALDVLTSIRVAIHPGLPAHAFDANGRITAPLWEAQRAAGTYDLPAKVDGCTEGTLKMAHAYDHLDLTRMQQLEELVDETKRDSVDLEFWFPPYHPRLANAIAQSPYAAANTARARRFIEYLARTRGVPLVDLSQVTSFGGDTAGWYDCVHYGPEDASRIANVLARHDP
jgi:hypothetical protein